MRIANKTNFLMRDKSKD